MCVYVYVYSFSYVNTKMQFPTIVAKKQEKYKFQCIVFCHLVFEIYFLTFSYVQIKYAF